MSQGLETGKMVGGEAREGVSSQSLGESKAGVHLLSEPALVCPSQAPGLGRVSSRPSHLVMTH